jgi:eukaryotic-like serine/threonine-protein kinase
VRFGGYRSDISTRIEVDVLPSRYDSPTLVARGGMGEVYRATDATLGRVVAIKMLADRHSRDADVRARFTREALAAARLSGEPYVITVFDVGEHDGRPFIVMEYLDGGTVHDQLRGGRVPHDEALEWLRQAAAALDAAHRNGVVHRDVKPANLLLDKDAVVRVSDFGIASATGMDTLTLPGTVLGTAGYLSPEQARGELATPASDRYALAVVAFELLTGRRPFAADTPVTEAFGHLNAAIPSAEGIAPDLPVGIDEVFARALAKDPAERPASATELVQELESAFESSAPPTRVYEPTPPPPRPPALYESTPMRVHHHRSRRNIAIAAVAGTLALGGGAVAALVGIGGGDGGATSAGHRTTSSSTTTTTTTTTTPQSAAVDGAALDRQGYALMQAGNYTAALPLLTSSVHALVGSGTLDEAYAEYNLAYTRFALGRCDGVLALLDRSERIQGHRSEIDRLRGRAEEQCGGGPGKGKGKKKGREGDEG